MQKPDTLIHTKLRLPSTRPELVFRPRLREQILQGLRGPLTLVIAPAGFGKTTLVATHITGGALPFGWLSLDRDDNQVARFLAYMVAAIHEADNAIGDEAATLLASAMYTPPEGVLTSLINDLDSRDADLALVLDDYHFISSQEVHAAVAFLIEHCPRSFHLVIATRSDPPLPLARLRARAQTIELRATDLSFNELEAARFLNDVMGLRLDAGSVSRLQERTEGWVAGLQMAALSMRQREDVSGFIDAFSGTNRYILDYLLEEVLAGQPPEIQRFLLHTSILERLSAPLCDAVLAGDKDPKFDIGDHLRRPDALYSGGSAPILEYLDKASLFLIPLDDERTWYRYHHLFADLLRAQLQKDLGAEGVTRLHLRAAAWHERDGSILEAIQHASLASDEGGVERLVVKNYVDLVNHGEMASLRYWTGRLSRQLVYSRPRLCIYEAYSHAWFGELDEADALLDVAESRLRSEIQAPDTRSLLGHLTYIKCRVTGMRGDLPRAIELNYAARKYLQDTNLALKFDLGITLGYLYFLNGDFTQANQYLDETIRSGRAVGAILNTVAASCIMARLYAIQGRLSQSFEIYQEAAQWLRRPGGPHLGAFSLIEIGMAEVMYERNALESALVHLKQGLEFIHLWGKADDLVLAHILESRIHLALADRSAAMQAVEKMNRVIQTSGVFPEASHAAEYARVKLWLARGDLQAASRWAASVQESSGADDSFTFDHEVTHIALAQVLLTLGKPAEAIVLLSPLAESARSGQRIGRVLQILVLKALALREKGDSKEALLTLTGCLELAGPEAYMRLFLDEGQPMRRLLAQWLAHACPGPLRDYAARLLSAFNSELPPQTIAQGKASLPGGMAEPLSQRELEVLHLMSLGKTNQEIAAQLIVALGTIKAHTASIYRKLEAANRTEAAKRARDLGILP